MKGVCSDDCATEAFKSDMADRTARNPIEPYGCIGTRRRYIWTLGYVLNYLMDIMLYDIFYKINKINWIVNIKFSMKINFVSGSIVLLRGAL